MEKSKELVIFNKHYQAMARDFSLSNPSSYYLNEFQWYNIRYLICNGHKLQSVKNLKTYGGLGLKMSKWTIDNIPNHILKPTSKFEIWLDNINDRLGHIQSQGLNNHRGYPRFLSYFKNRKYIRIEYVNTDDYSTGHIWGFVAMEDISNPKSKTFVKKGGLLRVNNQNKPYITREQPIYGNIFHTTIDNQIWSVDGIGK